MAVPGIVQRVDGPLREAHRPPLPTVRLRGRPDAERVLVQMGSGVGASREAVAKLVAAGEKVGLLTVRLYRPFDAQAFVAALPRTVRAIAVLDRTKEPGAIGEPLYQDVVTALAEAWPEGARPAAGDRRPLRPVVEGIHAGDGQGRARRTRRGETEAALHGRHRRRRHAPVAEVGRQRSTPRPRASRARCSTASAPTAPSARPRTRSRSSARTRRCTRRATSSTTARSRARSPSRTCASGRSRSNRPT